MTDSPRRTDLEPTRITEPDRAAPDAAQLRARTKTTTIGLNWRVVTLVLVIIGGAFAFSADSWINLARTAGFNRTFDTAGPTIHLSWALPIVVDAYTALTTWLYLFARPGSQLRTYAKLSAFTAAGLSVAAQGTYHGLAAADVDVAKVWPLVVAVGAIPPVLLGSAVHLLAIYLHEHRPSAPPRIATPSRGVSRVERRPTPPPSNAEAKSATPAPQRLAVVHAATPNAPQITDDEVAEAIRAHVIESRADGREPGQREMQRLVLRHTGAKVGQRRCTRVAATITDSVERELAGASA